MASVGAGLKFMAFFLWCCLVVPLQGLVLLLHKGQGLYVIPHIWHKGVCLIFGLRVDYAGTPHTTGQTFFVFNHVSYLDIPVIGSVIKASFVAKEDVAGWPVFGFLSRLQNTAFISRKARDAGNEKNRLEDMLAEGRSLIVFPEGTSTDGAQVLPFKSSLFSLALVERPSGSLMIQPVTLELLTVDGAPVSHNNVSDNKKRDLYAWYGEMTLPPHLWDFAKCRGARIRLHFHAPRDASAYTCRKALAQECRRDVAGGLYQADISMAA